jgi:hypothetical protein
MRILLLTVFILLGAFTFKVSAQQFVLSGHIADQKHSPIAFASVYIRNSTYGTTSNEDGAYKFKLDPGTYNVVYRFVGYKERIEKVTITDHDVLLNLQLEDDIFQLKKVSGKDKKGRDAAATDIMHKVIDKREYYLNEIIIKAGGCKGA